MKIVGVIPGLFIRGKFHNNPNKLKALAEYNINAVVSMVSREDVDLTNTLDIAYFRFPITDGKSLNLLVIDEAVALIHRGLRGGVNILVHCHGGKNRAGLVCALVVREWFSIPGTAAMAHVRQARPGALNNPVFAAYLDSLEAPCSLT